MAEDIASWAAVVVAVGVAWVAVDIARKMRRGRDIQIGMGPVEELPQGAS